ARLTVGANIAEPLRFLKRMPRQDAFRRAAELLEQVELPREWIHRYPHELSGGQCQRVCIARAIAVNPSVLICDEPVSALDVSIQKRILELLHRLREQLGIAILFIAHDLAVVRNFTDRILIMHNGSIVETVRPADLVPDKVTHPYTKKLLASVPVPDPASQWLERVPF
ncbi:MAG: ATP-binding cassette domain-containing protein, partial [Lentisphaerae bacterium]